MVSFTSISKAWIYLLLMIVAVVAAFGISVFYTLRVNPEVEFWSSEMDRKEAYAASLDRNEPVFIFVGGSSCAFSVDPSVVREEGKFESVNMGLAAGAGPGLLLELGLQKLEKGDVLVVAIETGQWQEETFVDPPALGAQLYFANREFFKKALITPSLGFDSFRRPENLRPGGYHLATMAAKVALGRPLYRYGPENRRPGGYLVFEDPAYEVAGAESASSSVLSDNSRTLLKNLVKICEARGERVVVSFPWRYVSESVLAEERKNLKKLAAQISEICPVLEDAEGGASSDRTDFADTGWHLSPTGAARRSKGLQTAIRNWLATAQ